MLGGELGVGGGVALPVRLGADIDGGAAVLVEGDLHVLALAPGGALDVAGEPDAAHQPLGPGLRGAGLEAVPVGRLDGAAHMGGEVAGIVGAVADRRGVGHRARRDEVAPADLGRRDPGLTRRPIDQALDQVGRLRPPGAAIGIDRHGVGVDAAHPDEHRRGLVDAGQHRGAEIRDVGPVLRQVGAEIADDVEAHGEEGAVGIERDLADREVVAALRAGDEVLAALRHPLHRPVQPARGLGRQGIFAVGEGLGAEAAADIAGDDADLVLRHPEHARQGLAQAVHALARDGEGEALRARIVLGDDAAGLHVVGDQALVLDLDLHHLGGLGEGGVDRRLVAHGRVERDVVGLLVPHGARAARDGAADADDRRPHRVVDADRLDGVAGLDQRVGDHEGDGVADMLHAALGQQRDVGDVVLAAVAVRQRRLALDVAETGDVLGGQHEVHARHRPGGLDVGDGEGGVGVRAAQERRMQAALRRVVVAVIALAGDQPTVLDPAQRLAEAELGHCHVNLAMRCWNVNGARARRAGGRAGKAREPGARSRVIGERR